MPYKFHSGIYLIEVDRSAHGKTKKFYVGQSIYLKKRKAGHWALLRRGKHNNRLLQRAWIKYGEEAFSFSIIAEVPESGLTAAEQAALDNMRQLYGDDRVLNLNKDIVDSRRGSTHSEEARRLLSEKQKANWQDEAYRAAQSAALKKSYTAERLAQMSAAGKEVQSRPEVKEKNRQNGFAHGLNPIVSAKRKATNARPEIKEKRSISGKKSHADPVLKAYMSAVLTVALNSPETKAKRDATNARPDIRAKRSAAASLAQSTDEYRQKQRKAQLIAQNRSEVKAKKSENVRKALASPDSIARRKATNARPEVKLRRSQAATARNLLRYGRKEQDAHAD